MGDDRVNGENSTQHMTKRGDVPPPWFRALTTLLGQLDRTNLQPSFEVNALFGRLVELCRAIPEEELPVGAPELGDRVRALAATGEANLERHWAKEVVAEPSAWVRFPFLEAYRQLVSSELRAVGRHRRELPRRWVFVGAGPLPLSPVLLEREMVDAEVTYVDRDPDALAWGRSVANVLNGARAREFVCASAEALDYAAYEVVVVAALAGRTEKEKRDIFHAIASSGTTSALVLARSVPAGGCELLYPRLDHLPAPWRVLEVTEPPASVINCTLLADRTAEEVAARDLLSSDGARGA